VALEELRLFLTVVEEGSLRRAAERAHISQSAVTRQMQMLEHDLGGRILERTSTGVRLTTGGHALAQKAKLLLDDYDSTMGVVRRLVRGESNQIRIGYVASAGQQYLRAPLNALRRMHPKVKMQMLDLSPGQIVGALRRGEIDLAVSYLGMDLLSRDFYTRKIDDIESAVSVPIHHRLASQKEILISELKHERFLQVAESCAPGTTKELVSSAVASANFVLDLHRFELLKTSPSFLASLATRMPSP
jgi:DNA-binding transcriptional LysR family regulator